MERRGELEELEKIEVGADAQVQVRAYIMYRIFFPICIKSALQVISSPHTDTARPVHQPLPPARPPGPGHVDPIHNSICTHPHSMWQVAAWRRPSFLVRTMRQWTASGRGSEALEVLREYAR